MTPEQIAKERADWVLDAVAASTQDRRYLRGEPEYDDIAGQSILLNAEKAILVAIERALKTARNDTLEEAAKVAENTVNPCSTAREVADAIRALAASHPAPLDAERVREDRVWIRDTAINLMLCTEVEEAVLTLKSALRQKEGGE